MKLLENYHTHLALCGHAVGMTEDYVRQAIHLGFHTIGISDHGPIPVEFLPPDRYREYGLNLQMQEADFQPVYLADIERSQKLYSDRIAIRKGLEIEYLPEFETYLRKLRSQLDYMALGMHFFRSEGQWVDTYKPLTAKQLMDYAETAKRAMDTGLFRFFVHPDLCFYSYKVEGRYAFDATCEAASRIMIEAAIRNHVYLEINAGGARRDGFLDGLEFKFRYPRSDFWKLVRTYKEARVIVGCDAHTPMQLRDRAVEEAMTLFEELGFAFAGVALDGVS